jgi:hypothetical protein
MPNRTSSQRLSTSSLLLAWLPTITLQVGALQAQSVFEDGFELPESCGFACDGSDADQCQTGILDCSNPGLLVCTEVQSFDETCNGSDDDCDELVDGADTSLLLVACEYQAGVCVGSMKSALECQGAIGWAACGASNYANHSQSYEIQETQCDGLDNDCDGITDEATHAPLNDNQNGVCAGSIKACTGIGGWVNDYSSIPTYGLPEFGCNGIDENCDGMDGQVGDNCE